jgi:hypothetical protein
MFALVLSAAPVLADAPVGQYEQFVRETGAVRDNFTKLEWERCSQGQPCGPGIAQTTRTKRTWGAAEAIACSSYGGRLPTVKELLTLVEEQPHAEYEFGKTVFKTIDQNAFGSYTAEDLPYWSGTPTGVVNERWGVSFKDGAMVRLKETDADGFYVRCVK